MTSCASLQHHHPQWAPRLISYRTLISTKVALTSGSKQQEIYSWLLKSFIVLATRQCFFLTLHNNEEKNPKVKIKFRGRLVPILAKCLMTLLRNNEINDWVPLPPLCRHNGRWVTSLKGSQSGRNRQFQVSLHALANCRVGHISKNDFQHQVESSS